MVNTFDRHRNRATTAADRRKAKPRSKRETILDSAAALFASLPYDKVNIDEVARAAEVAHGLVFYHFKDKRGLYVATLTYLLDELDEFIAPRPDEKTPEQEVRGSLTRYLQFMARYPVAMQSLLRAGLQDPELSGPYNNARQLGVGQVLSSLGEAPGPQSPALRVALRGWMGFIDQVSSDWLEGSGDLTIEEYVEVCFDALIWILHSAEGHRPVPRGLAQHLADEPTTATR